MIETIIVVLIGIFIIIKYRKEGKEISKLTDLISTDDLKITASSYGFIFLNLNSGTYDFCKFSKTEEGKVVLRLRYSLPKDIYQNWMTLGLHKEKKLTHFKIIKKELNPAELNIKIVNFFSSYSLSIELRNNEQYETLKRIFC